ncbi:uncharacterized protein [Palaemon carinicauda]|uniref:uncharacterized protein n=1 Tax=Palaemon carinicauda TaxID=392227 RepID=UPI0035B5E69C
MEFEENERVRRHESAMAKLDIEMAWLQGANFISSPKNTYEDPLNIGAALKLVPLFDGNDVPEFIKAFERVASLLSWPIWTILIQFRLVGKTVRVYNALEEGVARDYQKVKALILNSHDLVPEAYRLKFYNYTKHPAQSFVECAQVKEEQFDDWLKSRQIVTFTVVHELLLLEEFKKACSRELSIHLKEVKSVKLSSAAQDVSRVQGGTPPPKIFTNRDFLCGEHNRYNGNRSSCRIGSCFCCNKPGHFQNQCNARKIYLQRKNKSPVTLISDKSKVKFFRDSGSARSLVLKRVLNGLEKYTGNVVLFGGFPDSVVSAPLVNVCMSFPVYDRVTELAVVHSLPILGIDGILGNDMLDSEGREQFSMLSVNASPVAVMTQSIA